MRRTMWRTAVPCRLAAVLQGLVVRTGGGCRRRDLAPQAQGGTAQPCATSVLVFLATAMPLLAVGSDHRCTTSISCRDAGIQLFIAEDYKAAAREFERAVELAPEQAEAFVWLGRAYGRRAEHATGFAKLGAFSLARKVRSCFERAVEAQPSNLAALESLLSFYLDAPSIVGGGVDKADPIAEGISRIRPASGLQAKAAIHRKREEFEQAEALLRKAIELEPDEVGHLLSLASFLSRRERYDESDGLFAKAFQRQPDSPRVWYSRASELVRSGRNAAEARSLLERYLATGLYAPDAEPHSDARKLLGRL